MSTPTRLPLGIHPGAAAARLRRPLVLLVVASLVAGLGVAMPVVRERTLAVGSSGSNAIWYVGPGGGSGPCESPDFVVGVAGDGSDDAAIQAAVDAASTGDTVHLCDDVYDLTTGIDVSTATATAITFEGESTTGTVVDGADAVRLVDATGRDVTFVGLTLTNGHATDGDGGAVIGATVTVIGADLTSNTASGTSGSGGAVRASVAVTTIGGTFAGNVAGKYGGAVWAAGPIVVVGTTFAGNASIGTDGSGYGGAVMSGSTVEVSAATFSGNSATGGTYSAGGAIWAEFSVSATDATFTENSSGSDGGAIFAQTGTSLRGSTLAANSSGAGGAIVVTTGPILVVDSSFVENTAATSAGGAILAGSTVEVSAATFSGNSATGTGGAINAVGAVSVTGATFAGNAAALAGGAISAGGDVAIAGSEFSANSTAAGDGGAVYGGDDVASSDSLYRDNTSGAGATNGGGAIYAVTSVASIGDTFDRNTAFNGGLGGGAGGAIHTGRLEVTEGTFVGNYGEFQAGAIASGSTSIDRSTFHANYTSNNGGAIYAASPSEPVVLRNSTFVDNTAGAFGNGAGGGNILVYAGGADATLRIVSSTFVQPTAATYPSVGGLHYVVGTPGNDATVEVTDSIFVGGSCRFDPTASSTTTTVIGTSYADSASDPSNDCPGISVTTGDLDLQPLADNGGPTATIALGEGSVALDATTGVLGDGVCATATDQRGSPRPSRGSCDVGAFEDYRDPNVALSLSSGDSTTFTYGDTVTITATVATAGAGASDGTRVRLELLGALVTDCGLSDGTCDIPLTDLEVGVYAYDAIFPGDLVWDATTATISIEVLPKPLEPITTVESKTYDGTTGTAVTACELDGVVGFDDVTCDVTGAAAAFADASAGVGKAVAVSGLVIVGSKSPNYSFGGSDATTATISPAPLDATTSVASKTYDRSTGGTVLSCALSGLVDGESLDCTGGTATFADRSAGVGKPVTVTGLTLTGPADPANYAFSGTDATTATILQASLNPVLSPASKVYDGSTATTATCSITGDSDYRAPDVVTCAVVPGSVAFAERTAGTGRWASGTVSLGGSDAANYTLTSATAFGQADISAATVTATITVATRTYDGTSAATILSCSLTGVVPGDTVDCTGGTASFVTVSAGTKAVTATGVGLTGGDAANYSFDGTATGTGTITKRTVRLNADSTSKTYGTTDPALTATLSSGDFVGGETAGTAGVTGTASCSRVAGEAATTYAVDCTAGTLASTNYAFTGGLAGVLTILKRTISVAASAASKTYLGTDPVLGYGITSGSLTAGDSFTGALGRVAGETAGDYDITQGTLGVGGPNGSANYTIVFTGATFTIAKAATTATVTAAPVSPVVVGTLITFTVEVTSGAGIPDGTAGVHDGTTGGTLIGVCTLDGAGRCDVTTSTLTVGTHPITVTYAGGTNHSGSDGTTTVVVAAPPAADPTERQTVSFAGPIGAVVGKLQTLRATATSGLPVQFTSLTGGTCSIAGTTLTPLAVGDCTIVASQGGSSIWAPAPLVTRTFPVAATLLPLTMRTSFLINGEERLSVPIYVRKGTVVEMRLTTTPVLVGQTFEVWWRVGSGTWSRLTTRRVESSTRAARYTFTVRRDSVAYRWRFAGNELYQWQLAPGRRIFGL